MRCTLADCGSGMIMAGRALCMHDQQALKPSIVATIVAGRGGHGVLTPQAEPSEDPAQNPCAHPCARMWPSVFTCSGDSGDIALPFGLHLPAGDRRGWGTPHH